MSVDPAAERLAALEAFYAAYNDLWEEPQHSWRCEYRTEAVGWKSGDPPVIRCECGLAEFNAAAEAVRAFG